jgi:hypothetical protein
MNVPHLAAPYADSVLNLPKISDSLAAYSHHLLLADKLLVYVMCDLREQAQRHDVLLVVYTEMMSTQAEIAQWWETQAVYLSFIVPNT